MLKVTTKVMDDFDLLAKIAPIETQPYLSQIIFAKQADIHMHYECA